MGELAPGPVASRRNGVTIAIDRELCYGFGDCVDSAPGVFRLDEENKSVVVDADAQDLETLMLAAQDCPVDAILIHSSATEEQLYP